MPFVQDFVGGFYRSLSLTAASDVAINVFPETRRSEGGVKERWLFGTPGRRVIATSAGTGCRGLYRINGRTFVTVGTTLSEVNVTTGALTTLGTIADNGEPVSYASNGQGGDQVAIVGGNELKVLNTSTNTLSASVTLPFAGPVMVVFIDGYFLVNQRNSALLWYSALEDGTTWDALDFIARSGTADTIVGLGVSQNRVWVFGTATTTLYYDSGDADTPFLPYPGSVVTIGAITPWAIQQRQDIFTWLAQDDTGAPHVVKASGGPAPTTISTPPIEHWLAGCTSLTSAEALSYRQDGHAFFALTCPDSPEDVRTYVWDDVEQEWAARAGWNAVTGRWTSWGARGCVQVDRRVVVGDDASGALYQLDLEAYTDRGGILRRERRMPYISEENQFLFVDRVELACEVGVGLSTGQGSQPVASLRISRTAGNTWVSAGPASVGAIGEYEHPGAIWRRLGRARSDRFVLEVSQSDPVKVAWMGLHIKATPGSAAA